MKTCLNYEEKRDNSIRIDVKMVYIFCLKVLKDFYKANVCNLKIELSTIVIEKYENYTVYKLQPNTQDYKERKSERDDGDVKDFLSMMEIISLKYYNSDKNDPFPFIKMMNDDQLSLDNLDTYSNDLHTLEDVLKYPLNWSHNLKMVLIEELYSDFNTKLSAPSRKYKINDTNNAMVDELKKWHKKLEKELWSTLCDRLTEFTKFSKKPLTSPTEDLVGLIITIRTTVSRIIIDLCMRRVQHTKM